MCSWDIFQMALIEIGGTQRDPIRQKVASGTLIFDRFYKVFDMTECHVRFIYNTNAFLFILGIILGFGPKTINKRQVL